MVGAVCLHHIDLIVTIPLRELIEPNVPWTTERLELLRRARIRGIPTGIIIAPILPSCELRDYVKLDLQDILRETADIGVDRIYAEALHARGENLDELNALLGTSWTREDLREWDGECEIMFNEVLEEFDLEGTYWRENRR